jgi:hypothetical protein
VSLKARTEDVSVRNEDLEAEVARPRQQLAGIQLAGIQLAGIQLAGIQLAEKTK